MLNLLGVIIAFAVIIFLIRKKFNFGLSLIIGALIVGLSSLQEIAPIEIPKAFVEALIYSFEDQQIDTLAIELTALLLLIYILAKCMQETKAINRLIDSLRTIFFKGGTLGIIPAVYGLMPVPGGALFSAPMIDKEGDKYNLKQNQKNFLNVWWRHIWFPIFPISLAMVTICSAEFSNIDIYDLIIANVPAFIAFILIGLIFLKLFIKKVPKPSTAPKKEYSGLIYLFPPIIPILIYIVLFVVLFLIGNPAILKEYQNKIFIVGVFLSIIALYYLVKPTKKKYVEIIKHSISLNLALAIFGILIFREMVDVSNVNQVLVDIISQSSFPPLLIIIIIPLILGVLTGYNLGAVLLSYFLVEPFFDLTGINIIGLTSIIFISSLVGYLISPIHLCNVVSSDYLKTDTTRMYKMYIPAIILLLLIQTSFVLIFYSV
jgi:integral membrane protein (TIGR00529 family)